MLLTVWMDVDYTFIDDKLVRTSSVLEVKRVRTVTITNERFSGNKVSVSKHHKIMLMSRTDIEALVG